MIPRYLLSVDPGNNSAWVLWCLEEQGVREYGRLKLEGLGSARVKAVQELLLGLNIDWSQAHVVVEGQFYLDHRVAAKRGFQASPWTDVQSLIECRCAYQNAATLLGAEVSTAQPKQWIPDMTKGYKGSSTKVKIKAACRDLLPEVRLVADENDAALLGLWWRRQNEA